MPAQHADIAMESKSLTLLKLIFLSAVFLALSACNDLEKLADEDVVYQVDKEANSVSDVAVLIKRLENYPASIFSRIEFDENKFQLRFKNGAPPYELINYMAKTRGRLRMFGEINPEIVLDNRHISRTEAGDGGAYKFINIELTNNGAELLNSISTNNLGKKITVEFDGKVLMKPVVKDVLSKRFQISLATDIGSSDYLKTSIVIGSGALIDPIKIRKINL